MNVLDRSYIWLAVRADTVKEDMKEFFTNQDGVSNVVATIIVMLITVLLIAAFWKQLREWMEDLLGRIFSTGEDMDMNPLNGGK